MGPTGVQTIINELAQERNQCGYEQKLIREKKSGQIDNSKSCFSVKQHQQNKPLNSVIK